MSEIISGSKEQQNNFQSEFTHQKSSHQMTSSEKSDGLSKISKESYDVSHTTKKTRLADSSTQ